LIHAVRSGAVAVVREVLNKASKSLPGSRSQVEQDVKALRAAGVNSFDSLAEVLRQKSARPDVRLSACWLMGQLRDKRAVGPLLAVFFRNESGFTWEAAKAFGIIGSKCAVPILIKILTDTLLRPQRRFA
jgi:HEAT repeat protein